MTISGPGWPPAHICPSRPFPPAPQNLEVDTLSRKYQFSIQAQLNIDHLGAWLASGPYLPSPAFPPAPQNLGIDTLSRKYHFSIQTLLNNDHLGAWLASGPYLPSPAFPPAPQNLGIDTLGDFVRGALCHTCSRSSLIRGPGLISNSICLCAPARCSPVTISAGGLVVPMRGLFRKNNGWNDLGGLWDGRAGGSVL